MQKTVYFTEQEHIVLTVQTEGTCNSMNGRGLEHGAISFVQGHTGKDKR